MNKKLPRPSIAMYKSVSASYYVNREFMNTYGKSDNTGVSLDSILKHVASLSV